MKHTLFTVFGKWLLLLPFVFCSLLQIQAVQTPSAASAWKNQYINALKMLDIQPQYFTVIKFDDKL